MWETFFFFFLRSERIELSTGFERHSDDIFRWFVVVDEKQVIPISVRWTKTEQIWYNIDCRAIEIETKNWVCSEMMMKFLSLLILASIPVLKVLLITGLGSFLALPYIDILGQEARKHLNGVTIFFFFNVDYYYQYGLYFLYSIPVLKVLSFFFFFLFLQIVFRWFFTYSILPSSPPILLKLLPTTIWSRCMYVCSYNS